MRIHLATIFAMYALTVSSAFATCDGVSHRPCEGDRWCDPKPGSCDVTLGEGICRSWPSISLTCDWNPVCGCDGETYSNDGFRQDAKVGLQHEGECVASN
jgi:hypothetical protein